MRLSHASIFSAVMFLAVGCGKKPDAAPTEVEPVPSLPSTPSGPPTLPTVPSVPKPPAHPDSYGDPLPTGAVLRLGTERGKPANGWGGAMLMPDGKRIFAKHSLVQTSSYLHYTQYAVDGMKPLGEIAIDIPWGGQIGAIHSVSGDGKRMAAVNIKDIEVFEVATGKRIFKLPPPGMRDYSFLSLSGDGKFLAVGASFQKMPGDMKLECTVWNVDGGKEIARIPVPHNKVAVVTLSPDGKTLITSGSSQRPGELINPDDVTQIWDVDTRAELAKVNWPKRRRLQFSPDSTALAVVAYQMPQILLVDSRSGKTLHTLDSTGLGYGPTVFAPDGKIFAGVGAKAMRWTVATGEALEAKARPADLPGDVPAISAAFDDVGQLIAFGYVDKFAYCWEALTVKILASPPAGHSAPVRTVAFTPNGKEILSGGSDGAVCRWNATDGKLIEKLTLRKPGESQYTSAHVTADGRRALLGQTIYDLATGTQSGRMADGQSYFPTRDGEFIATFGGLSGDKKTVAAVYSAADDKSLGKVELPAGLSRAAGVYSPNRKTLVTAYTKPAGANKYETVITGWDLKTMKETGEVVLPNAGNINGMALVDDTKVVVGTGYGQLVVVDYQENKTVRMFDDPGRGNCQALTASPDGKLVAVCRDALPPLGRTIRIYDVGTGEIRHTIPTIDGRNYAILSDTIHLMDVTPPPETMAFSPDGTRLAVPALTSVLVYDLTKIGK